MSLLLTVSLTVSLTVILTLFGCGQRPCATPDDAGRDGSLVSADLNGPLEAVETGLRHFSGIVTYEWFEVRTDCVDGGELSELEHSEHDQPYPLLQSPDDPDLWGGWREAETADALLWLDWSDQTDGCFGDMETCELWPEETHELLGPWMSARDWYADVWWPLVTLE